MLYNLINTAYPEPNHPIFSRHQYRQTIKNKGLLLFYGTGTGKTRAALRIAESYITKHPCIIVTGRTIISNWKQEMLKGSTCNHPPFYFDHTNRTMATVDKYTAQKICSITPGKFYFMGYLKFCSIYKKNNAIFDNALIICDEAHRMMGTTKSHTILKAIAERNNNTMILMLTASPCFGEPYTIAELLNILIINSGQNNVLDTQDNFLSRMFGESFDGYCRLTVSNKLHPVTSIKDYPEFAQACSEHVSTVFQWKAIETASVREEVIGTPLFDDLNVMGHLCVVKKDSLQYKTYKRHVNKISNANCQLTSVVNTQTLRNICFGVFPDGSYGKYGSQKNFDSSTGSLKPESEWFIEEFKYENISKYSSKIKEILHIIRTELYSRSSTWVMGRRIGKMFIYCPRIYGMIDMLVLALYANGFVQWPDRGDGCFAIISGHSNQTHTQNILGAWNNRITNRHGDVINILIATEVIREGVTLLDTTHSINMEPDWKMDNTMQVNSRSIRPNALTNTEDHRTIKTYTFVSEFGNDSNLVNIEKVIMRYSWIKQIMTDYIIKYVWVNSMDFLEHHHYNLRQVGVDHTDKRFCAIPMLNNMISECELKTIRRIVMANPLLSSTSNGTMKLLDYASGIYNALLSQAMNTSFNQCNRLSPVEYDTNTTILQLCKCLEDHINGMQCVCEYILYTVVCQNGYIKYIKHNTPLNYELHYKWATTHKHQITLTSSQSRILKKPIDLSRQESDQKKYSYDFRMLLNANGRHIGYTAFVESPIPYSKSSQQVITSKIFKLITPTKNTKKRKHCDKINVNSIPSGRYIENYKSRDLMKFCKDLMAPNVFEAVQRKKQKATWIGCLIDMYLKAKNKIH